MVVVLLLVTGLGYGYFRYEWSKVVSNPCDTCVAAANGQPYNVLLIGSDTRAGETAAEAQQFGNQSNAGGQRSDTIKIVHVDPSAGTASSLSIPRDTYVTLSGMEAHSQLSSNNKINSAFSNGNAVATGADALIQTIQNTFGIPISHYIAINFFGLEDAVNALGGISMDFPYPVRDHDCNPSTGICNNNSGLAIPSTGCQVLNGSQALSLSRSRYFQYYANGRWTSDPTSDIGRIQRQNLIISAALNKAKSTYNPIRLNALLTSVVHDFSKDDGLSPTDLLSLAERYHAFSGSQLQAYTLPTVSASTAAGSAEVVEPDAAAQMITQFLGGTVGAITTPPLDAYGQPMSLPVNTTTTTAATVPPTNSPSRSATAAAPAAAAPAIPAYDPRPC